MAAYVYPRRVASTASTITISAVQPPGSSALWDTINGTGSSGYSFPMPEDSWREHLTATNQNTQLGASTLVLTYANSYPWNDVTKNIEFIGKFHGAFPFRYVRYNEATDNFVLVSTDPGLGTYHGYDHTVVNPYTGDVYYKGYGSYPSLPHAYRATVGASTFSAIPDAASVAYESSASGVCWWSGRFTPTGGGGVAAGVQGAFMWYDAHDDTSGANNGTIQAFNPLTNNWFYYQTARAPFNGAQGYHAVMDYSKSKNVAVYGGGNTAAKLLWRMDKTGTVLAMPVMPTTLGVGAAETTQGRFVVDPSTGNFLAATDQPLALWELNPDGSGTWTQKAVPPTALGYPSTDTNTFRTVLVALPEHSVVACLQQNATTGGRFFLYKNKESYFTNFDLTENPISESGKWVNGKTNGIAWQDIATANGNAIATHKMVVTTPQIYDDNIAHLATSFKSFSANQYAEGTLYRNGSYTGGGHEIELYCRLLITPNNARGYEAYWNVAAGSIDIYIVRWNGALNDFTYLTNGSIAGTGTTGDLMRMECTGTNPVVITVKVNGVTVVSYPDGSASRILTGQPGLGQNPYGDTSNFTDWAFSSWRGGNL